MTVAQNISYPLETRGFTKRRRSEMVDSALHLVRLEGYGDRYPSQLSGGQQQRVALARALVFEPQILLMDEALSALDKRLREAMQLEIRNLQKQLGITTIIVTHDQTEAMVMSDVVAIMNNGRIEQIGPPMEVYRRPANQFVANFIGECNFFEGHISDGSAAVSQFTSKRGAQIRVKNRAPDAELSRCCLTIRPEAVHCGSHAAGMANQFSAELRDVVHFGDTIRYQFVLATGDEIYAKELMRGQEIWNPGDQVVIGWRDDDGLIVSV